MRLTNNESYISSCMDICRERLAGYKSIVDIEKDIDEINKYPNIDKLEPPRNVFIFDDLTNEQLERAKTCILEGKFFAEHAAAGEATRLGLGTKYTINFSKDLPAKRIAELMQKHGKEATEQGIIEQAEGDPSGLQPLSLGTRHMMQYSFDIYRLARENNMDPEDVLARQKMLVVLNETTNEQIISEFIQYNFFGFSPQNVFFIVQNSYHGITLKDGEFIYDKASPRRLHNHGQMVMQQTMDNEIFRMSGSERKYLSSAEFEGVLEAMEDKQSFCIEDMEFLISAIDLRSLALALAKSDEGYRMMMEIVANNPDNPQKGGMAAFDPVLGRNVMIESFQLKGIENSDIKYLNKNFNHYPKPVDSFRGMREKGLNMPFTVKGGYIYFQPVQGDINFLVKTEFMQSKVLKPIKHWKDIGTAALMARYMRLQDAQEGFLKYADKFIVGST